MPMASIDVRLTKGIDEAVGKEHAEPGTPLELTNLLYDKQGRLVCRAPMTRSSSTLKWAGFQNSRNGLSALVYYEGDNGAPIGSSTHVVTWGSPNLWRIRQLDGMGGCSNASALDDAMVPMVAAPERMVIAESVGAVTLSIAIYSHYMLAVSEVTGDRVQIRILDLETGTIISQSPTQWGAGISRPKAFWDAPNGQWAIVVVSPATPNLIMCWVFPVTGPDWATLAAHTVVSNLGANMVYDAVWPSGDTAWYLVYHCSENANLVWANCSRSAYGALSTVTLTADGSYPNAVAISQDGKSVLSTEFNGASFDLHYHRLSGAHPTWSEIDSGVLEANVGITARLGIGGGVSDAVENVYMGRRDPIELTFQCSRTWWRVMTKATAVASLPSSVVGETLGPRLLSKPYTISGTGWFRDLVMCEHSNGTAICQWQERQKYPFMVYSGQPFSLPAHTRPPSEPAVWEREGRENRIYFPCADETSGTAYVISVEASGARIGRHCVYQNGAVALAGGTACDLSMSDSIEHVPVEIPEFLATATAEPEPMYQISGSMLYVVVFQVKDSLGRIGRGIPSVPVACTLSNERCVLLIPSLGVTRLPSYSTADALIYRSTDGGLYYYVGEVALDRDDVTGQHFSDSLDDPSANEKLYTQTGEPYNAQPAGATCIVEHKGRLFGAIGSRVYYTKWIDETYLPRWSDAFYLEVQSRITALASLGDILLILCDQPDAIYYISGDGPDNMGNGAFSVPSIVTKEVGCPSELGGHNSTIVIAGQAFFRSRRGIETMGTGEAASGQSSVQIGAPIQDTLRDFPFVQNVVHLPECQSLAFVLRATDYDETNGEWTSKIAVYSYRWGTWHFLDGLPFEHSSTLGYHAETLHVGRDSYAVGGVTGGCWQGVLTTPPETLIARDTGAASTVITATVKLAPIAPFGLVGWGYVRSVQLSGEYLGDTTLSLKVYTDTADGGSYTAALPVASTDFASEEDFQLNHKVWRPKTREVTLELSMALTGDAYGNLPPLYGLSLEVEKLPGVRRNAPKGRF